MEAKQIKGLVKHRALEGGLASPQLSLLSCTGSGVSNLLFLLLRSGDGL